MEQDDGFSGAAIEVSQPDVVGLKEALDHPCMMLLAVHGRAMAVIGVAPLLAFRIFIDGDGVVGLSVFAELDIWQAFAVAVTRMRGLRAVRHRMLTELAGREYGRLRLLCRRRQQDAKKSQRSPCHRVGLFIVRARL